MFDINTYTITAFAQRIGVNLTTLQRWNREGHVDSLRTPTNRRVETDEHWYQRVPLGHRPDRGTVVSWRVSRQAHKPDLEPQRQA